MPRCENTLCGKMNLTKDQVDIHPVTNQVLCLDCMVQSPRPMSTTDGGIQYGIHYTNKDGLTAEVSLGEVKLAFRASTEQLKEILGS